jgi:uncharacterized protein (DUF2147 family)
LKNIILILLFSVISVFTFSQTNADLVGQWYNAEDNIVVTLFEDRQMVSGKVTWMKYPNDENGNPKTDLLNPDESLRNRESVGMIMLSSFTHIAGNVWDNGRLYDPKKGKTYTGIITLKDANSLNLRGYVGLSFIERSSSTWTRYLDEDLVRDPITKKRNLLIQLTEDLNNIIKKIENENLLIQLREDLNKIIKKIEELKKAE